MVLRQDVRVVRLGYFNRLMQVRVLSVLPNKVDCNNPSRRVTGHLGEALIASRALREVRCVVRYGYFLSRRGDVGSNPTGSMELSSSG